jgi:hypothetical protein
MNDRFEEHFKVALADYRARTVRVQKRLAGSDTTWPPMRYLDGLQHGYGNAECIAESHTVNVKADTEKADERMFFYQAGRADAILWVMGEVPIGILARTQRWLKRRKTWP